MVDAFNAQPDERLGIAAITTIRIVAIEGLEKALEPAEERG